MTLPVLSFVDRPGAIVPDLDRLMEFGVFVEGASRSGKTNLVRVFLEQTYGLVQHIVVDVEGEYVSLRSAARPYLIVGRNRDVELPVDTAAIVRFVLAIVEKGVSVIFDLSEYDIEEQQPIVAAICDALVSLPESHAGAAAVVLEELQDFAPEGGGKGTAINSVRRLSKRGLKRGFFIVGASQRVSDVSKGVVTQLKTKMIGGTDLKDAPRALEELGLPSKDKGAVTDLAQGDFWVKGPAFDRHAQLVRPPRSVTAPPKRKRGDPPTPAAEAPAEIAALAKALAAAAAPAAVQASSPADAPSKSHPERSVDVADRRARRDAIIQRARDEARFDEAQRHERYRNVIRTECEHAVVELQSAAAVCADQFREVIGSFVAIVAGIDEQWVKPVPPDPVIVPTAAAIVLPPKPEPTVRSVARKPAVVDGSLSALQQKILNSLAELEAIGIRPARRDQVTIFANYSTLSSGTGGKAVAALAEASLVEMPSPGQLELTPDGRKRAERESKLLTRAELHRRVMSKLTALEQRILHRLIADPRPHTRDSVCVALQYSTLSSGTGGKAVAKLIKLNLVDAPKPGLIQASSLLFPGRLK